MNQALYAHMNNKRKRKKKEILSNLFYKASITLILKLNKDTKKL
jgi:hypothetical protein